MGLTFQQKFYQLPDEVFLVTTEQGHPIAIIEKPEDKEEAIELQSIISMIYPVRVQIINFDNLVLKGLEIVHKLEDKGFND